VISTMYATHPVEFISVGLSVLLLALDVFQF